MKHRILVSALFASLVTFGGHAVADSGTPANDESIVAAVKTALAAKPELKTSDIKIASKSGEVTLSGTVDSGPQLYNIADTAQKVAGVKWVNNEMSVKQ